MTHTRNISLIGYCIGFGAEDERCKDGPEALKRFGLHAYAAKTGAVCDWQSMISEEQAAALIQPEMAGLAAKTESKTRRTVPVSLRLKEAVRGAVASGALPVVIGGDHSQAIGEVAGVKAALGQGKRVGLVYVDAHLDGHTGTTTPSGNTHGMSVAALIGYGDPRLTAITADGAALEPEDVAIVCARDYEEEEHHLFRTSGVGIRYMEEVQQRGFARVMDEVMQRLVERVDAICLQIDLDAFDPQDAPATGYNIANGLRAADALSYFSGFLSRYPQVRSVALTEYNPHKDDAAQSTARLLGALLEGLCQPAAALATPSPAVAA